MRRGRALQLLYLRKMNTVEGKSKAQDIYMCFLVADGPNHLQTSLESHERQHPENVFWFRLVPAAMSDG